MEEQGYNIRTLFRRLDKDNDDFLSFREFTNAAKRLFGVQATDDEFERVFEKIDTDRSYKLNLGEFEQAVLGTSSSDELQALIKRIK